MMKLGIIGLDSSHAVAFANILNNQNHAGYIPDHPVVCAYPGEISSDFDMSYERMDKFTEEVTEQHGVALAESISAVMEQVDAVFLEQVDARKRFKQFEEIVKFGKPVFVDKPFALSGAEAGDMAALAEHYGAPLLSTSALRYADSLTAALRDDTHGEIDGADFASHMPMAPTQPGFFWYGCHAADMLYAVMGAGCETVYATSTTDADLIVGTWRDGRIGTVRGSRLCYNIYTGVIQRRQRPVLVDPTGDQRPFYDCLIEQVIRMFDTGVMPVSREEMVEVIRFLEAANESVRTGNIVRI